MITMRVNDNARKFLRELEAERRAKVPKTTIGNRAPHAPFLQFRHGYVVIDDVLFQLYCDSQIRRVVNQRRPITRDDYREAMERATDQLVEKMQSFTSKMRPPVRAGGPMRPAHKGGWADRTTELASSYHRRIGNRRKTYDYEGKRYV